MILLFKATIKYSIGINRINNKRLFIVEVDSKVKLAMSPLITGIGYQIYHLSKLNFFDIIGSIDKLINFIRPCSYYEKWSSCIYKISFLAIGVWLGSHLTKNLLKFSNLPPLSCYLGILHNMHVTTILQPDDDCIK